MEFPSLTHADWLAQITKDLKGRPASDLDWPYNERLRFSPTARAPLSAPLPDTAGWEINERITVTDPAQAHTQALEALEFGAEGLCFYLPESLDIHQMEVLLEGIYIDMIGLHFEGPGVNTNPGLVLALLTEVATRRGYKTQQLRGSLAYDPLSSATLQDWRYLSELIELGQKDYPGFRLIRIAGAGADPDATLADILRQANTYLAHLTKNGISPGLAAAAMSCQIAIGTHYFVEIAKLRAFKILWMNWLKAWGAPVSTPAISVVFHPTAYTDDLYTNMIRATTMAMSAVIGGAWQLTVRPYDEGREAQSEYPQRFARRIARNVQHLLKMESGMDQLTDPAAGSHYIEDATQKIAESAWHLFKEAPGG